MQILMIKGHGDYYDDERVSLVAFSLFLLTLIIMYLLLFLNFVVTLGIIDVFSTKFKKLTFLG